jgi:signal transduction histidine kinase
MGKKIKILHLEDSLNDSELIRSLIDSGEICNDYFLADNEKDFLKILETENIDIILSDYSLPDYNGNEALKVTREKYSQIPFIFVSGAMGEDAAINAMVNGATDYVLKNKLERLVPAINRAMREHELEVKRKQDEINLKEKNEQIIAQNEKYVIINKELEKAKIKAEESDRLKSVFITNLSHELRTPLNSILGFSQLITGTDDKQQIMDFSKIINKGGNQLLIIIEDLLIVSSILSENTIKKIVNINLGNLLDKARFIINDEMLKSEKKDQKFSIFDGAKVESADVLADNDLFGEIIRKLIRNAIKFTDSGEIEVGYSIENNENIQFYVRDTGIGIPIEKQEFIFDFFRQVEELSIREFGGIGSGLAICKSFVEKMNGKIWVESKPGEGSTFYFTLPLAIKQSNNQVSNKPLVSSQVEKKEPKIENNNEKLKIDLSNRTVLIVDDIESNRKYLSYILKDFGATVLLAENGKIALEMVKKTESIDLILMDLIMPIMDGYESTRAIKIIRPEIPVIAQTAYSFQEHRDKAIRSGCNAFIKKPINTSELIIAMNESLNKIKQIA